jgi:hypothetical protein
VEKGLSVTEDNQFDQDDVVEYLENGCFHKDNPDPDDVLEFASEDELEDTNKPTEEMLDRYHEYVNKCVEWAQRRMSLSDEFHDMFTNAIENAKWADDYDMFTASIRDFLDAQGADKAFSRIKDEVLNRRATTVK